MPPNDRYPVEGVEPLDRLGSHFGARRLPLLATPITGEALPFWLHRCAQVLDFSPAELLLDGEDGLPPDDTWWRHPAAAVLERMAWRTGAPLTTLRTMSFTGWKAHPDADEVFRRFGRLRFRGIPLPHVVTRRFGVCIDCIRADALPYVRKEWTLGWSVACEQHRQQLIYACQCGGVFMMAHLSSKLRVSVRLCSNCAEPFSDKLRHPVNPLALNLQRALFKGRDDDAIEWPAIGVLSWAGIVSLIDSVLFTVHGSKPKIRKKCFDWIALDMGLPKGLTVTHHDAMALVAWVLNDWPARMRWLMRELKAPPLEQQLEQRGFVDLRIREELCRIFAQLR